MRSNGAWSGRPEDPLGRLLDARGHVAGSEVAPRELDQLGHHLDTDHLSVRADEMG